MHCYGGYLQVLFLCRPDRIFWASSQNLVLLSCLHSWVLSVIFSLLALPWDLYCGDFAHGHSKVVQSHSRSNGQGHHIVEATLVYNICKLLTLAPLYPFHWWILRLPKSGLVANWILHFFFFLIHSCPKCFIKRTQWCYWQDNLKFFHTFSDGGRDTSQNPLPLQI